MRVFLSLQLFPSFNLACRKPATPTLAHVYSGHTDLVRAVDYRAVRGSNGAQTYQLVSWSKDQTLRLWCVDEQTLQACGYNPAHRAPAQSRAIAGAASTSVNIRKSSEQVPNAAATSSSSNVVSPSRTPLVTLEQEFQQCERSLGGVLEKLNLVDRTCVLVARNDALKQTVVVKISFPSMYPMHAAPAFEFAPRTTLPLEMQAQVKEVCGDELLLFLFTHIIVCSLL